MANVIAFFSNDPSLNATKIQVKKMTGKKTWAGSYKESFTHKIMLRLI